MPRRSKRPSVPEQPLPSTDLRRLSMMEHDSDHGNYDGAGDYASQCSSKLLTMKSTPKPCPPIIRLIDLPDDVLRHIFLHVLDAPDLSAILEHRSLDNFEYALWIARAHPALHRILTHTIHTLLIHRNDTITPDEVTVISPELRHFSLICHSLGGRFLRSMADKCPPMLRSLHLEDIDVPDNAFINLIASCRLTSLSLCFVTLSDVSSSLTKAATSLQQLRRLSLHGFSTLRGENLYTLCSQAGPALQELSLRYVRHMTFTGECLLQLTAVCPNLKSLDMEHILFESPHSIFSFCEHYALSLTSLRLCDIPFWEPKLYSLLMTASQLVQLSIGDCHAVPYLTDGDAFANALIFSTKQLDTLEICDAHSLSDMHIGQILNSASHLSSLVLRHLTGVGEAIFTVIATAQGPNLRRLDLGGCVITDAGLQALATNCTGLRDIALGSDGFQVTWHDAERYETSLSNAGIDALLKACGSSLTHFFWESYRTVLPGNGPIRFQALGVSHFHAKSLAISLASFCPHLLRVEVNWLRPHTSRIYERAECDLAFFNLDRKLPHVAVFLDREPL